MASVKTFIVGLFCGVVLLSAVTTHASVSLNGLTENGMPMNGMPYNGLTANGQPYNGAPINGMTLNELRTHEGTPVEGPRDGLPFIVISQRALGKTHP